MTLTFSQKELSSQHISRTTTSQSPVAEESKTSETHGQPER